MAKNKNEDLAESSNEKADKALKTHGMAILKYLDDNLPEDTGKELSELALNTLIYSVISLTYSFVKLNSELQDKLIDRIAHQIKKIYTINDQQRNSARHEE